MRPLIILVILISGCASTSVPATVSQENNDVVILCLLAQDHIRTTHGRSINLDELLKKDTSNRISTSFKRVELKSKGGHISLYFEFSESRDPKSIVLSDQEKERVHHFKWKEKELNGQYDGEIQFDYGERFYRVIKIVIDRPV